MTIVLARILWIEGRADQARHMMQDCLQLAYADSPFAISHSLALGACPLAMWMGDDEEAERLSGEMLRYTERFSLGRWYRLAQCYRNVLLRRRAGDPAERERLMLTGPEPTGVMQHELLVTFDELMIDKALTQRALTGAPGSAAPEMLRAAGERRSPGS